jgi:glycosyltransferase involved in cell wall biosynthesis
MKRPFVNITIPVYNEERILAESVVKVAGYLQSNFRYPHEIVIADNASTDRTFAVAQELQVRHDSVRVLHLDQKGRGRAVKRAWAESKADILSYMDCDLSTDLAAFPPLIESLTSNGFDVAVGSRLLKPSLTTRGVKREVISRGYNLLIKALFRTEISDAQCGFKAITRQAAQALLPLVKDGAWFMDTELLILAEKLGFRIFDLPVRWVDDPDSRVKIWSTALADLKGLVRVKRRMASIVSTVRNCVWA